MKITYLRQYRNTKGSVVFAYEITATEKEKLALKEAQGDYYREDEQSGKPLFFTTRFAGDISNIIITSKKKVVVDMSSFEKAASLSNQFTGYFGKEIARQSVAKLLGTKEPEEIEEEEIVPESTK